MQSSSPRLKNGYLSAVGGTNLLESQGCTTTGMSDMEELSSTLAGSQLVSFDSPHTPESFSQRTVFRDFQDRPKRWVGGLGGDTASVVLVTDNLDVAAETPACAPGVLDEPVVLAAFNAVT